MKILFFSLCTLLLFSAKAQDNINALKFSSTLAFEQFVDGNSLANLHTIDGFTTYQPLKTTFAAEPTPPAELSQDLPDDGYDISNDAPPADDKNDYSTKPWLGDILNTDKVVIIGNWIIKIDLVNDRALMLNKTFSNQYSDLVNNNLSNTNILSYSINEEGLEIIEQLDNGNVPSAKDCRRAFPKDHKKFVYRNNRHRLDMKVVYQRLYIFQSLEGKAKTQKRVLGIWWHHGAGNAYMSHIQLDYQKRCSGGFSHWGDPAGLPGYVTGSTCHYQPYMSARGLKNYFYQIDFVSTHGSGRVKIEDY